MLWSGSLQSASGAQFRATGRDCARNSATAVGFEEDGEAACSLVRRWACIWSVAAMGENRVGLGQCANGCGWLVMTAKEIRHELFGS